MAWEKWQDVYEELKIPQRIVGGEIRRLLNRKMYVAWE
jgi:hypothetical protein